MPKTVRIIFRMDNKIWYKNSHHFIQQNLTFMIFNIFRIKCYESIRHLTQQEVISILNPIHIDKSSASTVYFNESSKIFK